MEVIKEKGIKYFEVLNDSYLVIKLASKIIMVESLLLLFSIIDDSGVFLIL